MLFLALSGAYIYNRFHFSTDGVQVPILFYFNTLLILGSSFYLNKARRAFDDDNVDQYRKSLVGALVTSLLFLIFQLIAWQLMFNTGLNFGGSQAVSYLFLIPMLHFIHLLGGLPFLVQLLLVARKRLSDPTSALVFFSDPSRRRRLKVVTTYWHFVDLLWIYLVLFFTISSFV